jgi:hypothetical protein
MADLLLTGAGFSYNWGGLLGLDFFGRLLGDESLDAHTRGLMFENRHKGGFEQVMAILQSEYQHKNDRETKERLQKFTGAIIGLFNGMNNSYLAGHFEFQNEVRYMVRPFLERFDALFTLNQDGLLEIHYFQGFVGGRWDSCDLPGTKNFGPPPHIQGSIYDKIAKRTPDLPNLRLYPRRQPYIKLHGSANWVVDEKSGILLILGGAKTDAIKEHPLLVEYLRIFREHLTRPNTRLMIIGYSFHDEHINEAILAGISSGLKIFIVDPRGVAAIENIDSNRIIRPSIIGESRKPLTATFGRDHTEHDFLMSFFK